MSLKTDLEKYIREAYNLIHEYEDLLQLSNDPKEQARSKRTIEEQWRLIKDYLSEYIPLCKRLSLAVPEDIAQIAVIAGVPFPSTPSAPSSGPTPTLSTVAPLRPFPNVHALLIGIAAYRHIRPLTKTATDARDLYDTLLQNGYSPSNMSLLLDEQATKAAISDRLDWLARRAGPDDTVIIFFSGHGAQLIGGFWPGEYLCPVEAALDKVKDTFISDEEFTTALRAIRAGRVVVFLDACHAGGVGEPKDPAVHVKAGLSEAAYTRFLAQGRVIIASCKPDEVSYELAEMRNSLFTHYLLEGLHGGAARPDGTVWITNLFGYVYEQVSRHNLQHPFQKSATEDFIVALTKQPEPGPQLPATPRHPTVLPTAQFDPATVDPTKLRKAMHSAYDRLAFEILCKDLGLDYHDLRGETLETKMLYLIDHFQRRRQYEKLVRKVLADHPYLADELR